MNWYQGGFVKGVKGCPLISVGPPESYYVYNENSLHTLHKPLRKMPSRPAPEPVRPGLQFGCGIIATCSS